MPGKRPNEPIGPTNVPGQPLDPRIPDDEQVASNEEFELPEESEEERQDRESERVVDEAGTRAPRAPS